MQLKYFSYCPNKQPAGVPLISGIISAAVLQVTSWTSDVIRITDGLNKDRLHRRIRMTVTYLINAIWPAAVSIKGVAFHSMADLGEINKYFAVQESNVFQQEMEKEENRLQF